MTEAASAASKEKDFAFREYEEIIGLLKQSSQMVWTGYGAYFTVNSLLFTAFGLIMTSDFARSDPVFALAIAVILAVIGIFLSAVAIVVIRSIAHTQHALVQRGKDLEDITGAQLVSILGSARRSTPWPTIVGAMLFAALWCAVTLFAVPNWKVLS